MSWSPSGDSATPVSGFLWPNPPFIAYPEPEVLRQAEACEVLGLNNSRTSGELLHFSANDRLIQINVPPTRQGVPLKFGQFRAVKLLRPVVVGPRDEKDRDALFSLDQRPRYPFRVVFQGGEELKGITIGNVQDKLGLFLFVPLSDTDDSVRRIFVPQEVLQRFELGERIGDVLVKEHLATPEQVAAAAEEQQHLRQRRVGDILVEQHVVSAEQLVMAVAEQARMPTVRIGEALLALELVTPQQLERALERQRDDRSVPLGELLVRQGVITRAQLQSALAHKMGYPIVDIDQFGIEPDAVRKLPHAVAKRLEVVPLVVREGRLFVAMEDPTRRDALDEIEFVTQLKAVPALCRLGQLPAAIASVYEKGASDGGAAAAPGPDAAPAALQAPDGLASEPAQAVDNASPADTPAAEPGIQAGDHLLVRLINSMILEAQDQGATDIHIESQPTPGKLRIRFRCGGLLQPYVELPPAYRDAVVSRLKAMADLNPSERRRPQEGKIAFSRFLPQHALELRILTLPTQDGLEDIVLHLLSTRQPLPLDALGMAPDTLHSFKASLESGPGLVLCVGPNGAGVTTTLHAALGALNTPERKVWAAEDRIEFTQSGLRQIELRPGHGWTAAEALRQLARADADVICVSTLRERTTAEAALEAALGGHLVLSSLHGTSAAETLTRLMDTGLDAFSLGDALRAVMAQRLVRRSCNTCKTSEPLPEAELAEWLDDYLQAYPAESRPSKLAVMADWMRSHGQGGRLLKYTSTGCSACQGSGYKGRVGLQELLTVSRPVRRLMHTGASAEALQHAALANGMRTLRQDGLLKVLQGITSLAEVHAATLP